MELLVNTTPHKVNLMSGGVVVKTWNASSSPLRYSFQEQKTGMVDNAPIYRYTHLSIDDLPACIEGVLYIASHGLARYALDQGRNDFVIPYGIIRDDNGGIIGCIGFAYP